MFTAPDTQCIRSHKLKLPKGIRTQKAQNSPYSLSGKCGKDRSGWKDKFELQGRGKTTQHAAKQHALLDEQLGGNFPRLERHRLCLRSFTNVGQCAGLELTAQGEARLPAG